MKRKIAIWLGVGLVLIIGTSATILPNNRYFEIIKNIEIFTSLYKEINTYYVDDVDPGKLMRTGIDAMVGSLDPFTNYISETDIESYRFMTEGKYNGIGALSKKMGEYITITELYKDQAADKAGLKPGDQLIAVDGKDAKNKDPEALNNILRGFPGTEVELTIRRPGQKDELKIKLMREEVEVPNVPYYEMVSGDIGYITLTTFTRAAGANVANALSELKKKHPEMKGVILDLRDNGGGLLNEAVDVCNVFVPRNELVVTTRGKVKEWDRSYKTTGASVDETMPLAVIIDKGSASASEIVSGVIQDYDRGVLIGQRSYGKGLVQNTRDIGYNSKVKMTTAKYYIPSQRCIQSVEYKNGEPVEIADAKRTAFKTRAGRTVYDGGGVKPDMVLDHVDDIPVVKNLMNQDLIFDYATQYCLAHPAIAAVMDFRFTEFNEFTKFVEERGFQYDSDSEKLLKQLLETSKKESMSLESDVKAIEAKIKASKKSELAKYKDAIVDLIEKEIAGRYYYQNGKIQIGLRNDIEIKEAMDVLRDPSKYKKILTKG